MKRTLRTIFAIAASAVLMVSFSTQASGQSMLNKLGQAAKKAAANAVKEAAGSVTGTAVSDTTKKGGAAEALKGNALNALKSAAGNAANAAGLSNVAAAAGLGGASISSSIDPKHTGPVYYVSEAGNNRSDGTTPATAKKDIQKVLDAISDAGQNGAIVRVAAGNYLGTLDAGYIEIKNFITLEGGWNADFTARDPHTNITRMQPTQAQLGTNGSKGLITVSGLDNSDCKVLGTLVIDGIMLDFGNENFYLNYDPEDPKTGSPEGVDTGRMVDDGGKQVSHQLFHVEKGLSGNLIIRNCLFLNSPYFAIQFGSRAGEIDIYNCVFVSNRYGSVRIDGIDKDGTHSHVNFHHNTVAFSWCRDKMMEDMGYGFECMNKINCDIHNNVFLCNNYAAIARTRALSGPDAPIEARKVTNIFDNYFFMNAADIQLPSRGGGMWTNVMVSSFEDIDAKIVPNIEGNKNLDPNDPLVGQVWQPYLNGFANLRVLDSSSSSDPNSAANLYRQAHGMNLQGTQIHRVSMFGNRYRFDEALKLFGAKENYGAQKN